MPRNDSPSPSPPSTPSRRRMKTCARRFERACCTAATYFPLAFVYSLTTWAVWVDASIGFTKSRPEDELLYSRKVPSSIGVLLYLLLNASYTTAVFTDPGSPTKATPSQRRGRYSILPTSEFNPAGDEFQAITVSSTGASRYCKKCHVQKPDRSHHCSTCKRCVMKMDHHCPWLATCLGLHNYKAFVLFLIYTTLFCWACFGNTVAWTWKEVFGESPNLEELASVNVIMLAVLSGIIGLVLTGFTSWHIYLCIRGLTTIECLEKTRYLSGVRKVVEQNRQQRNSHSREASDGLANNLKRARDQIIEFHANAVPGASRYEEGEEHTSPTPSVHQHNHDRGYGHQHQPSNSTMSSASDSPAQRALRSTYSDFEQSRESARYEAYLDEKEASALPNAFDLGWRKNLSHLFGPKLLLWLLPICNTTGDGWRWEVSPQWMQAQEELSRQREERLREAASQPGQQHNQQWRHAGHGLRGGGGGGGQSEGGAGRHYHEENNHEDYENEGLNESRRYADSAMSMQTLKRHQSAQKMRRDFDSTGEDGEVASFQVSGSEDEDEDDNDHMDVDGHSETGRVNNVVSPRDRNREGGWGQRW